MALMTCQWQQRDLKKMSLQTSFQTAANAGCMREQVCQYINFQIVDCGQGHHKRSLEMIEIEESEMVRR